ncbi:MAG TPA: beta-ketoacyl-ACP synthase II [Candidatus Limnocylindrales bacterium]|nr:beta-ketoacyl-ACP synthase II [Candidatus Limnocylindrales bacterium]
MSGNGSRPEHRVVVTGMGVLVPNGVTLQEYWDSLIEGRSGLAIARSFDVSDLPVKTVAELKNFDPKDYMDFKEAKRMARFSQVGIGAARMALEQSGLDLTKEDRTRIGCEVGTGIGGFKEIAEEIEAFTLRREHGPERISPFFVPRVIPNMASCQIAIHFGLEGPNNTDTTACAASTQSLGNAYRVLQRGDADVMMAGGAEANLCRFGLASFAAMRVLSTEVNDPTKASRPFDAHRDGFVPGEGAGMLVLESLEHAERRDAPIFAELVGFAVTDDAYHIVMPEADGDGPARAMQKALDDAHLGPGDIDYINAHGTSTQLNDKSETAAIKRVFAEHAARIPISSTKSMIGHLLGAAGAVEAIATILSINNGMVHPTINLEHPDPDCDLDYVPNQARRHRIEAALSNSFGFGGQNACLIIKKFDAN